VIAGYFIYFWLFSISSLSRYRTPKFTNYWSKRK